MTNYKENSNKNMELIYTTAREVSESHKRLWTLSPQWIKKVKGQRWMLPDW